MAEPVTITPHDARRTAFRAIVDVLQASDALAPYVAAWEVCDGAAHDTTKLDRRDNAVRLTPEFENESVYCVKGSVRTWESPVLVKIDAWVASANVDNVVNLAGLIEGAVAELTPAEVREMGISWVELVTPPAQAVEYGQSVGAFRIVVHIEL